MFNDLLSSFDNGNLARRDLVKGWLTDLGSSLYAYMVMLELSDRKQEAKIYKELRTQIFEVRNKYGDGIIESEEMESVSRALNNAFQWISIYRPDEATILQAPANDSISLAYYLKVQRTSALCETLAGD